MKTIVRLFTLLAIIISMFANSIVPSVSAQSDSDDQPRVFHCIEVPCWIVPTEDVEWLENTAMFSEEKQIKYDETWDVYELRMRPTGNFIDGTSFGAFDSSQYIPAEIHIPNSLHVSIPQMGIKINPWIMEYQAYDYWDGIHTEEDWIDNTRWTDLEYADESDLITSYSWDGVRLWVWRWYALQYEYDHETIIYVTDAYFAYRETSEETHGYLTNWQDLISGITWPDFQEEEEDIACQLAWATGILVNPGPDNTTLVGLGAKEFWYETYNCEGDIFLTQTDRQGRLLKTHTLKESEGYISLDTGDGVIAYKTIITIGDDQFHFIQSQAEELSNLCSGEYWYEERGWHYYLAPNNVLDPGVTSVTVKLNNCSETVAFDGYRNGVRISTFTNYYQYPWEIDFAKETIDAAHITAGGWSYWFLLNPTTQLEETNKSADMEEQVETACQVWYTSQNGNDGFKLADYYHYVPRNFILKWADCQKLNIKADDETVPVEESTNSQIVLHFEDELTGHLINKFEVFNTDGELVATFYSKEHDNFIIAFLRKYGPTLKGLNWPWWIEATLMLIIITLILLFLLWVIFQLGAGLYLWLRGILRNRSSRQNLTMEKVVRLESQVENLKKELEALRDKTPPGLKQSN